MDLQQRIEQYLSTNSPAERYAESVSHYYVKYLEFLGMADTVFVDMTPHRLIDQHGDTWLDLVAGYGSCHFGRHPKVLDAIRQAADLSTPNLVQFSIPVLGTMLAEEILEYIGSPFSRVFFTNGGAESTEYALKMARNVTGKSEVLCFEAAYHGLTLGAMSVNGAKPHQKKFNTGTVGNVLPFNDVDRLESEVKKRHRDLAAIIIEPVQGRTGEVANQSFIQRARSLCDKYGLMLIFDEIKTGFGRTGKPFFFNWYDITPDIITIAKGVSGGICSLGGVVYQEKHYKKVFRNIESIALYSSTFKENNFAMAAGLAVLELFREQPDIYNNVLAREQQIRDRLVDVGDRPFQFEVNGKGLLLAVTIKDVRGKRLMRSLLDAVEGDMFYDNLCRTLFQGHKILVSIPNRFGASIALIPALDMAAEDIDEFCDALIAATSQLLEKSNLKIIGEALDDARTVL